MSYRRDRLADMIISKTDTPPVITVFRGGVGGAPTYIINKEIVNLVRAAYDAADLIISISEEK